LAVEVSVVIPTHNRCDTLLRTLEALAATSYESGKWEVIVVDDGSTDDSANRVEAWARSAPLALTLLRQDARGPAAARNAGARSAAGNCLIFLDNDMLVPPALVGQHVASLRAHPGTWTVGRVVHPAELRQTPFGRYRDDLHEAFYRAHPADAPSETQGITTQNLSLPAGDFRHLGGFDESFTIASCEDMLLGIAARASGIRTLYHPDIVAVHNDWAVDLASFCHRQRLYSVSDVLLWNRLLDQSPRAQLVQQNAVIPGCRQNLAARLKRGAKGILATAPAHACLRGIARVAERIAPDTRVCRGLYNAVIAAAIYQGVQEGVVRYGLRRPE
jgi:glycosyltransferase involved in cell wall biosynthesis